MKKKGRKNQTSRKEKRRVLSKDVRKLPKGVCSRSCSHDLKGMELTKLATKIKSSEAIKCEECRELRAGNKVKSEDGKKRKGGNAVESKSEESSVWICLECGCFLCGSVGSTPRGHAVRHSKSKDHSLAIWVVNPNLCWCFHCKALVSLGDGSGVEDLLDDVVAAIKGRSYSLLDAGNHCLSSKNKAKDISYVGGNGGYVSRGLVNLGNTCFFNSILQNLLSMGKLRSFLLNLNTPFGPLTASIQKLFYETNNVRKGSNVINPRSLFGGMCAKAAQFRGYQQHDSHELLRCLLDVLCTEELSVKKHMDSSYQIGDLEKDCTSFVEELFGGQTLSTVLCMECGHVSSVCEPFLDLSLPVPEKRHSPKKAKSPVRARSTSRKGGRDLTKSRRKPATISGQAFSSCPSTSKQDKLLCGIEQLSDNIYNGLAYEPEKSVVDLTWLDFLGPQTLEDNHDDTFNIESDLNAAGQNVLEKFQECESSENSPNNVVHNQLPESETLSLPAMEEPVNSGATMSKQGDDDFIFTGQNDPIEFDGFGGLFDEPDLFDVSGIGPLQNARKSDEVAECGSTALNNSDSETGEVDHTDSPVSVDSCLAFFTKPELLLVNEHAWHCENCSRIARNDKPVSSTSINVYIDGEEGSSLKSRHDKSGRTDDRKNISAINTVAATSQMNGRDPSYSVLSQLEIACSSNEHCNVGSSHDEANPNCRSIENSGSVKAEGDSDSFKVRRNASKRILINRTPQILTIHLKRFCQDARGRLRKLNGHVVFSDLLDLRPYMDTSCVEGSATSYRLVGVVEHLGSMRGGHYVAYVRGMKGEASHLDFSWYYASDSLVREASLDEVLRSEAYILFYERIHA